MSDKQRPTTNAKQPQQPDVDALTRAVERLLKRDLELARERLRGGKRP